MATALPRCTEILPRESSNVPTGRIADTVTLDETDRHRRRIALTSDGGIEFLLDLPSTRLLKDGDRLLLTDDRVLRVRAAAEPLLEVRGEDSTHLLRLAWHLGNRHQPSEIHRERLVIRHDHVIAAMLRELGAEVREIDASFDPEGGAYDGPGHTHQHAEHGHPRAHHAPQRDDDADESAVHRHDPARSSSP